MDAFEALLTEQAHVCAICGCDLTTLDPFAVCVDHDHVTGKVRGVLCRHCNTGLGSFKDNPDALLAAVVYLKKER